MSLKTVVRPGNTKSLSLTIGPLVRPNKAIGYQVSDRTVVDKIASVL